MAIGIEKEPTHKIIWTYTPRIDETWMICERSTDHELVIAVQTAGPLLPSSVSAAPSVVRTKLYQLNAERV